MRWTTPLPYAKLEDAAAASSPQTPIYCRLRERALEKE